MSAVNITCTSDSSHLSMIVDPDTKPGKQILLVITSQGSCGICGNPIAISSVGGREVQRDRSPKILDVSRPPSMLVVEDWASGTTAHPQTSSLRGSTSERSGVVSSHISQLLPVRAALDVLAELSTSETHAISYISVDRLNEKINEVLPPMRRDLIKMENRLGQTARGSRPSSGFPMHLDESMPAMWNKGKYSRENPNPDERKSLESRETIAKGSKKRFEVTVVGGIDGGGGPYGALYDLGLVEISPPGPHGPALIIGLTEAGAELARLENPLIHRTNFSSIEKTDLETRFSEQEIEFFWNHSTKNLQSEADALEEALKQVSEEPRHIVEITEHLVKRLPEHVGKMKSTGNPPGQRSYTSSMVNRWTGLGVFERPEPGMYVASPIGSKLLSYERKERHKRLDRQSSPVKQRSRRPWDS